MAQIVFVDPQDKKEKFWWPGIIVDQEEYDSFFKEMGEPVTIENDCVLVCYFEDASYSSVKKDDIKMYDHNDPDIIQWMEDKKYKKTRAIKAMLAFLDDNKIPTKFKWLKREKRKYKRRKNLSEGVFKKKVWMERANNTFKDVNTN